MTIQTPPINLIAMLPQIILIVSAIVLMMIDSFSPRSKKGNISYIALVGTIVFAFVCIYLWGIRTTAFDNMLILDSFSLFLNLVFALTTALTILVSVNYVHRENIPEGEYYALLLFAASGMSFLASSGNLLVVFLGLEILSLSLYILTTITRERLVSNEAALKYFLLGAFASGFLLYGIALIFGATGSTDFTIIGTYIRTHSLFHSPLVLLSFSLMLVGFAFKVALVPFHMWTPDVYQGAPSSVTGFMATGVKAAGFAVILRLLLNAFNIQPLVGEWKAIFWVLAVLTMTLGNVVALVQTNVKRMLAYSSIAHAGYLCIGIVAFTKNSMGAMLFYFVAYTLMNIGAFAIVLLFERNGKDNLELQDYRGLSVKYPLLSLAMAILMFSLAGIPPTAGFIGKFYIFSEAVKSGAIGLAIIGVLNSLLSVYYYLRVTVMIYMSPVDAETPSAKIDPAHTIGLTIAVLGTLLVGLFPYYILHFALKCFVNIQTIF